MSQKRDVSSGLIGLFTFLLGLAMIGGAFWLAYGMFRQPPNLALNIIPGKVMDFGSTIGLLLRIVVQILALLLMTIFGSVFANRGIRLYEAGRPHPPHPPAREEKKSDA